MSSSRPTSSIKLALVIAVTLIMAALILAHVKHVNGPWYWTWSWRRLTWWLYPAMLLAATPFALAQWLWQRQRRRLARACLVLSTLALTLVAMAIQPPTGLRRIPLIVQNAAATGYYTDASILNEQPNITTREWLNQFPQVAPMLHHHARYKPPGLLLYYLLWIDLFGKGATAATVGGLGIALIAAFAPVATFAMLRRFTGDDEAAFMGASYLALCPALLLFLPMFDLAYVTVAAALLRLYGEAVLRPGWRSAAAFGVAMTVATLLSYVFLMLGVFFIVYWLTILIDRGRGEAMRAARSLLLSAGVCIAAYAIFWLLTGFDPIATFRVIAHIHDEALVDLARPYPQYLFYDVLDFILGSGYASALLVAFWLVHNRWQHVRSRELRDRVAQVGLIQIAIVAGAGLLPGEAARLWMLLLPLLMAPISLELGTWPPRNRYIVYACLWLIAVVLCQNMTFVYMGPEFDGPR